jgi:rubrerythrin
MEGWMVIEQLNDLLGLERGGLGWRLSEVESFVDPTDAAAANVFKRIIADERTHEGRLAAEIVRLGGVPRPTTPDMSSAGLHYLGARYLLPLLIEEKHRRVAAYQQATSDVSSDGGAAGTVAEILSRHQAHLKQLESLADQLTPTETDHPTSPAQDHDA